jgi:hypothetical protein|tara:strand:+ start:730 stop:1227 length:498 start_codon:yes stop_codon:yes gene_type:complete
MNKSRLEQILNAYGADSHYWPEHEKAEALALIRTMDDLDEDSQTLKQQFEHAQQLDIHLAKNQVPDADLAKLKMRIVSAVTLQSSEPKSIAEPNHDLLDRLLDWFIPNQTEKLWQPTFAAALTLIAGILIGSSLPKSVSMDEELYYENEIYLLGLSAESVEVSYE